MTDKILSNFRVGLISVEFDAVDMSDYFMYDEQLKKTRYRLITNHDCPKEPYVDVFIVLLSGIYLPCFYKFYETDISQYLT